MKNKVIILTGMPGAGKGAISTILKWQPNIRHVSAGELLRALDPESELGKQVFPIMNQGLIVNDDIVNQLMEPVLVPAGKDLLLDGYPRSTYQTEFVLKKTEGVFDIVGILLKIDESIVDARRQKRINDCKLRGEEPRADDLDPTALQRRFAEYYEKTHPTIEFLREKLGDKFFEVDGKMTLEDVYDNVMKILTSVK